MNSSSNTKPKLKLDWCSHEAAKYAVMHWHYSKRMPKSKLAKIGVWEDDKFIGVVIYGVGATGDLCKSYGLAKNEGCELVRVALSNHFYPVTKIVAISLKIIKSAFPKLNLVVSFADPEQNHSGGIYQAGNWVYAGKTQSSEEYIVKGKRLHGRAFRNGKPSHLTTKQYAKKLDPNFRVVMGSSKHRYLYPLTKEMRVKIESLAKPYPKRAVEAGD